MDCCPADGGRARMAGWRVRVGGLGDRRPAGTAGAVLEDDRRPGDHDHGHGARPDDDRDEDQDRDIAYGDQDRDGSGRIWDEHSDDPDQQGPGRADDHDPRERIRGGRAVVGLAADRAWRGRPCSGDLLGRAPARATRRGAAAGSGWRRSVCAWRSARTWRSPASEVADESSSALVVHAPEAKHGAQLVT
jgi:GNAT superfamily N-acetyltransferase